MRQELFEVGDEGMAVAELAEILALNASEVVKILFMKGLMVQVNQVRTPLADHADHDFRRWGQIPESLNPGYVELDSYCSSCNPEPCL